MPYYKFGEISELVKERNGLGEAASMKYFIQIASAIEYLHNLDIAHRDIKLENVLLDNSNNAKLIDFGFSYKAISDDFSSSAKRIISENIENSLFGTLGYMAPELIEAN